VEANHSGNRVFFDKNMKLDQNAYHFQCSHLLLLHQGFRLNLYSRRWFQLTGLGTSAVRYYFHASDVANDCLGIEKGEEVKDDDAVNRHRNPSCPLCWDEGHTER
jgi:hypothetical protein